MKNKTFIILFLGLNLLWITGCTQNNVDVPPVVVNPPTINPQNNQTATKKFSLILKNKKIASESSILQVNQGDQVVMEITSDEDEELHLHGYDLSINLEKYKPAQLTFKANISGRFPYELEKSSTELGTLEVLPQ